MTLISPASSNLEPVGAHTSQYSEDVLFSIFDFDTLHYSEFEKSTTSQDQPSEEFQVPDDPPSTPPSQTEVVVEPKPKVSPAAAGGKNKRKRSNIKLPSRKRFLAAKDDDCDQTTVVQKILLFSYNKLKVIQDPESDLRKSFMIHRLISRISQERSAEPFSSESIDLIIRSEIASEETQQVISELSKFNAPKP